MIVEAIPCLTDNLCYLVTDEATATSVLIDASEAEPILQHLNRFPHRNLRAIILTHHHPDHVNGVPNLPIAPVFCSMRDAGRVPCRTDRGPIGIADREQMSWSEVVGLAPTTAGSIAFEFFHIPGHTEGQMAILIRHRQQNENETLHLFVGDTLFSLGCGRCLEGTPVELFNSLSRIKNFPPETLLYFGHEYTERNRQFWETNATDLVRAGLSNAWRNVLVPANTPIREIKKAPRLSEELLTNPFLQFTDLPTFTRWRSRRDQG